MAVSLDTVSVVKGSGAGQASISWSHTVAASANGLVVGLGAVIANTGNRYATSVTYNGVAMSSLTSLGFNNSFSTSMAELWYLQNPATGANTVSVTLGGTGSRINGFGVSLIGASGVSATGAPSTMTAMSTAASLAGIAANGASDYLVAVTAMADGGNSLTLSGNTLSAWTKTGSGAADAVDGVAATQASGTSNTVVTASITASTNWVCAAVAVLATAAGGGAAAGSAFYTYRRRR